MAAYDALPPEVRQALANSNHQWAPHWALWAMEFTALLDKPAATIVERIEQADRDMALHRKLQLLKGQG